MPRPPKPSPPLGRSAARALAQLAETTGPAPVGTLDAAPLSYHGLILSRGGGWSPVYVISAHGRAWLAADAAYRASAPRRRRVARDTPDPIDTTR